MHQLPRTRSPETPSEKAENTAFRVHQVHNHRYTLQYESMSGTSRPSETRLIQGPCRQSGAPKGAVRSHCTG